MPRLRDGPVIRLVVALFHTALALATATVGVFVLLQGRANVAWELGFYETTSVFSSSMVLSGVLTLVFGVVYAASALAWFAGSTWGGWGLLLASTILVTSAPLGLAAWLFATMLVVALDLMVTAHRRRQASEA